jgi:hypothetical protein
VYKPLELIVPTVEFPPTVPSTLQFTLELPMFPVTVAVNCCVWVVVTTAANEGVTLTVTLGTATVRETGAVGIRLPDVPVIVTEFVPVAEEALEVRVRTLVVVVLGGLNAAETPAGKSVAANPTLPLNPFCGTTVIVVLTNPPWPTLGLLGDAESVKLGCGPVVPPPPLLLPPPHPANATASETAMPEHSPRRLLPIDDSPADENSKLVAVVPRCDCLAAIYFACGWISSTSMVI